MPSLICTWTNYAILHQIWKMFTPRTKLLKYGQQCVMQECHVCAVRYFHPGAIILLLTHKWPQYFLPTQPTNQYKSLTALFQIPTTSAFIHFHLLQKLSLLKSSTLALQFSPPHPPPPPPLMPAISPQGGWNCPSQWKAPRWQPRLRYWPTADSQAGTEIPTQGWPVILLWARWNTGQIHKMNVKEPTSIAIEKSKTMGWFLLTFYLAILYHNRSWSECSSYCSSTEVQLVIWYSKVQIW